MNRKVFFKTLAALAATIGLVRKPAALARTSTAEHIIVNIPVNFGRGRDPILVTVISNPHTGNAYFPYKLEEMPAAPCVVSHIPWWTKGFEDYIKLQTHIGNMRFKKINPYAYINPSDDKCICVWLANEPINKGKELAW